LNKFIIYAAFTSNRLTYVLDFIFNEVLGVEYVLTSSETDFLSSPYFRINYSHKNLISDIHIDSNGLLFENEIVEKEIYCTEWNELPIFFQTQETEIPFDIFAAIFYLLSRYEEYLPYEPDSYFRFPHIKSIAFQNNFLNLPLIDLWIEEIKKNINGKNHSIQFKENTFQFIPSYDIDIAYSFKGKGFVRNLAGTLKDLLKFDHKNVASRLKVLFSNQKDPYDSFLYLDEIHEQFSLNPIYFFLLSEGSKYDKNLNCDSSLMKKLISTIQSKYEIGIHPSWKSHENINSLQKEVLLLKNVKKSRQHYIRFALPETFRNLLHVKITDDYSMGYGSINGFRASTSRSFNWFDLEKNEETLLRLHPFCFMECNSFFEQKFTAEKAFEEMHHYATIVKKVNGNLITIWHNFSLGTDPLWKGWKEKYIDFLKKGYHLQG
jgi:hypothetical protein